MKLRTLCLLVSEGVKWKASQAAHTQQQCVCAACMCALFRLWGSHVCFPSVRRVLEGGETTYTSTCAAFLVGPLQSQGWGHYRCEPLAARHCLAISVLALYSESIEQEPH